MLKKLREKSEPEKKKIFLIVIISATVIIFLVWLIALPKDYLSKDNTVSFNDIKKEFEENEDNKKLDAYMNSLGIYQEFEDGFDLDEFLDDTGMNNSAENINIELQNKDENEEEFEYGKVRLPLEE